MSSDPQVSHDQLPEDQPPTEPHTSSAANPAATDEVSRHSLSRRPPKPALKFTRAAATWTAMIVGFGILIVLLVFIAQNTGSARFTFLGWHWSLPLGVAILFAAVCGGFITTLAGTARIFQLRRTVKRTLKAHPRHG
jgi:uncharacterized integral membrane protein